MSLFNQVLLDMNGLTYFLDLSIQEEFFGNVGESFTLDLIKETEMKRPSWEEMAGYGLQTMSLSGTQMSDAASLMRKRRGLSIYDAGLLILCRDTGIPLITEDKKMISEMEREGWQRIPLPDVVGMMMQEGIISHKRACRIFDQLGSTFLKKRYDCKKYLEKYSETSSEDAVLEESPLYAEGFGVVSEVEEIVVMVSPESRSDYSGV
ncbi:hypothetical protein Mlab_1602 [Methanocorpusculum labreanum Z]|uniref:Nucleic acid-binding protein contains PIN domain-like protein n=1 Tax=Methanocorpusculum labreanum (strain ATCC 43576 / DSM 4855 / Z) TaxID=410358 RepID=A2STV8_METLZ|nr:adenine deaminase [Methanocorpusculum labreanum]ABN07764.1 hypothetical protein Mlab_1602 [Methanocorpusculum labreanum Z]